MSKKIKSPKQDNKVDVNNVKEPQALSVTFRYLSKNKARNFEFFGHKDLRRKADALEQLIAFLQRLTSKTLLEVLKLPKDKDYGCESMKYSAVNCRPHLCTLEADDLIFVFRFGDNGSGGDYRLLGFFEDRSAVFNVIGVDFDYSAYQHE